MTLPEKILALRTEKGLSQGELAERLEVSRQSVSKWETGQSVPDLDKIIRLADLFEITVDELVRESAQPESQPSQPTPEPQVVYVEKRPDRTPAQILGIILTVLGGLSVVVGLLADGLGLLIGIAAVLIALPLLLAKKHPWLICGWVIAGLCYAVFNPFVTSTPLSLPMAVSMLLLHLNHPDILGFSHFLGIGIAFVRGLLTLTLLIFTLRLWLRPKK